MNKIKIKAPCKINLDLKIKGIKDGYHLIESVMQTVNLCDFVELKKSSEIEISGTKSDILPYNTDNIAYKAAKLFFEETKIKSGVKIFIEKNIPISAGLAGGSTDAAATLYGLNKMFDEPLNNNNLLNLCEKLGSDLNFCLTGGRALVEGRGEIITKQKFTPFNLTIVKPKNIGISAGFAYKKFDEKNGISNFQNDLEWAIIDDYKEFQYLHSLGFQMSGSGSSYFKIGKHDVVLDDNYEVFNGLSAIDYGVVEV